MTCWAVVTDRPYVLLRGPKTARHLAWAAHVMVDSIPESQYINIVS